MKTTSQSSIRLRFVVNLQTIISGNCILIYVCSFRCMYRLEFAKVCKNTIEMTVYNAYVLTLMRDTFLTV